MLQAAEDGAGCAWADLASAAPQGVPYGKRESIQRLLDATLGLAGSLAALLTVMPEAELPPPEADGDITVHPPLGERCFTKEELS
jgi:hypothetical protein